MPFFYCATLNELLKNGYELKDRALGPPFNATTLTYSPHAQEDFLAFHVQKTVICTLLFRELASYTYTAESIQIGRQSPLRFFLKMYYCQVR